MSTFFKKNLTKSTESGDPDAYGLAAIDIYNVLNETDALKGTARTVENAGTVKDLLNQTLNDDGIQTAKLNLNPENSPYFMVSGMKTLPKKWEDFVCRGVSLRCGKPESCGKRRCSDVQKPTAAR